VNGSLLAFFLSLTLALAFTQACSAEPGGPGASDAGGEAAPAAEAESPREIAPEFTLTDLDGREVELTALRGRTVILDFWATWCPPCEFQVPELNAFYEAHRGDSSVEVIGISVDTDGPEVVSAWVEEKKVRYRIAIGDEDLARRYGAIGFPTLVIVAPDGTVDSRHVGLIETADLEEALARQDEV
jgi:thiol-disulfide isomerase/thioredoxin